MKRQTTFDHECELEHFYGGSLTKTGGATATNVIDADILQAAELLAMNMAKSLDDWVKAHTGDTGDWEDL